jgi:hypothetical protein
VIVVNLIVDLLYGVMRKSRARNFSMT